MSALRSLSIGLVVFAVTLIVMPIRGQEFTAPPARPEAPVGTSVLLEHADECWQGNDEPLAELPGAAIVSLHGKVFYTTRHDLVDEAFAEALADIGYGNRVSKRLDPVALCL